MNEINYLRKQAGLPLLVEVTDADITRALGEVHARMLAGKLDESIYSMLKATLATVGQKGSKANKAAAERATKLSGDIRKLYKETEAKAQLRLMYKQFTVLLTTLEKIDDGTKDLQDKDADIKREIELFQRLISRITVDLQARAGVSVAVQEAFTEDELATLLEQFMQELLQDEEDGEELHVTGEAELTEATYVSSAEFSDDFYSLLDSLKTAARAVGSKRGKLRRWLRRSDFANNTKADELFDVFLNKFHDAMVALRSADKQLQKKL